jgi:hypothetical protein
MTGTSGSIAHSASANLTVNASGSAFSWAASPLEETVTLGGGTGYSITVTSAVGLASPSL